MIVTPDNARKINEKFTSYQTNGRICGLTIFLFSENYAEHINLGEIAEGSKININNDTLFEIGSLTKPIIASLFSIFESKNEIDLQKSLSYYLKDKYTMSPIFDQITIEDVLAHSSGLPRLPGSYLSKLSRSDDPYSELENADLEEFLKTPDGIRKPGQYHYSNLGYGILGELLKTIFHDTLDGLAEKHLFNEVGMNRTGTLKKFAVDNNIATGYTSQNKPSPFWTGDVLDGAGCFLSTNNDMVKFLKLNLGYFDTPVTAAILKTHTLRTKKTGLAWHHKNGLLAKLLGFSGFTWHNGMTGGFSSYMAFHPKKKAGIFLMANKAKLLDHFFYYYSSFVR